MAKAKKVSKKKKLEKPEKLEKPNATQKLLTNLAKSFRAKKKKKKRSSFAAGFASGQEAVRPKRKKK